MNGSSTSPAGAWRAGQVSLFALVLAAAGLPLYIHLPRFASVELGLSLSAVGAILIGIRVMDFVQDPVLGWMVDRWPAWRGRFAALALAGMAAGFVMLFSVAPPVHPALWLALSLVLVFTAYSLGAILFYGQSAALAGGAAAAAQYRLAMFREGGALAGVVLAALAPVALARAFGAGYVAFGIAVAMLALAVAALTRGLWRIEGAAAAPLSWAGLREAGAARLLGLAFVNALPVAITSTLFLFFVSDRLGLPDMAGPFLILFFLAAGLAVPLWSRLVTLWGARRALSLAMGLAIAGFMGAAILSEGAVLGFAVICVASGAALGADMVILPALFATRLAQAGLKAGQAFGLWSFAAKLALAIAAVTLLPLLDRAGFVAGGPNDAQVLVTLTFAYAVLPCLLKLIAIWMVLRLPKEGYAT